MHPEPWFAAYERRAESTGFKQCSTGLALITRAAAPVPRQIGTPDTADPPQTRREWFAAWLRGRAMSAMKCAGGQKFPTTYDGEHCHAIREPKPAPRSEDLREWEDTHESVTYSAFGAGVVRTMYDPPRPVDESGFEVIRICKCSREWGQV